MKIAVLLEMSEGLPLNEEGFDALADALYEMDAGDPAIEDMDLTAAIVAGPLVISMTVDAEDLEGALHKAVVTLRAALHEIGLGTPGWERALASMQVRLTSSRQLVA